MADGISLSLFSKAEARERELMSWEESMMRAFLAQKREIARKLAATIAIQCAARCKVTHHPKQ